MAQYTIYILKYISIYSLVLFFFLFFFCYLRLAKGIFDDILHDFDIGKPKRKTRKQRLRCLLCIRLQHLGTEPSHFGSYGEDLCKGNRIVRFSPFWEYICPFSPYNYKWYPIIPAFSMVNSPKNFHFGWLSITRNPLRGTLWRRQVDGFRCVSWMVKSERSPKFVNLRCPESIIYTLRHLDQGCRRGSIPWGSMLVRAVRGWSPASKTTAKCSATSARKRLHGSLRAFWGKGRRCATWHGRHRVWST